MTRFPELDDSMRSVDAFYRQRGIFQDRFGFGNKPAVVVVDFAYGWTDDAYAGGSRRLNGPVENTARLLDFIRSRQAPVPIVYTTSPWHPDCGDQPFKSAADKSPKYRAWDERACQIDQRVAPTSRDLVIEKENASAFFGTHLIGYLVQHGIDMLLITGCSTSACIRATATDAKSYRLKPIIIRDCVGDRAEAAHEWTLFDIQARFADVEPLDRVLDYLASVQVPPAGRDLERHFGPHVATTGARRMWRASAGVSWRHWLPRPARQDLLQCQTGAALLE